MKTNTFLLIVIVALGITSIASAATTVTIQGEDFSINGARTFAGGPLEGTLPNSRMVQATFDDANTATVGMWSYPGGIPYNPVRQTAEFIAALPSYRAKGLLAVSVNFQGGRPVVGSGSQPWDNTAFNADGSLKTDYMTRMDAVIRALDAQGMVAILGYFYFGQAQRLSSEAAVKNAVTDATQWVLNQGYTNVLIEIANECDDPSYSFAILQPARIGELISAVQTQSASAGHRLYVGVSFTGGVIPTTSIAQQEDFILLHGNNQTASNITAMVNTVRSLGLNKPIVFNEDSPSTANFQAATDAHASWGYHDPGLNNYVDGFQSPPTNWTINTDLKKNFFNLLAALAGMSATPIVPGVSPPPIPTAAAPFTNGSFESDYTGWSHTGNQNIYTNAQYPTTDGTKGVQFNGAQATPNAVLSQTFFTIPGRVYTVNFDVGVFSWQTTAQVKGRVTVTGSGGGVLFTQDIALSGIGTGTAFSPQAFTFTASGASTTLSFTDISPATQNIDLLLDNVRVSAP